MPLPARPALPRVKSQRCLLLAGWLGTILAHSSSFYVGSPSPSCPSQEYMSLDLHAAIVDAGFTAVEQRENTPRHRTVVATKQV